MRMSLYGATGVSVLSLLIAGVALAGTPSPPGARVYILAPADGERVASPLVVKFGLQGMGVAPAGVQRPKTGHHHLLVDAPAAPPMDRPLPADAHHRHFGGGQTEARILLPPGRHRLQLIMGDARHVPHDPPVISEPVTVIVE